MKENGEVANIIVGDFAGVENSFQCDNINTIQNLLNIKRDKTNELYYSSEIKNATPESIDHMKMIDPVLGGDPEEDEEDQIFHDAKGIEDCRIEYIKTPDKMFDFMMPQMRESMISLFPNIDIKSKERPILNKVFMNLFGKDKIEFSNFFDLSNNIKIYDYIKEDNNIDDITKNYDEMNDILSTFEEYSCSSNCDASYNQFVDFIIHDYLEIPLDTTSQTQYEQKLNKMKDNIQNFKPDEKDKFRIRKLHNYEAVTAILMNGHKDANTPFKIQEKRDKELLKIASQEIENFKNYLNPNSPTYYKKQIETIEKIWKDGVSNEELNQQYVFYYPDDPDNKFFPIKIEYTMKELLSEITSTYFYDLIEILQLIGIKPIKPLPLPKPIPQKTKGGARKTMKHSTIYKSQNRSAKQQYKIQNIDPTIYLQIITYYPEFSEIIKQVKKLYKKAYEVIIETKCRIGFGEQICENRNVEGTFINDSLEKVRRTIKEIMVEKNKDVLYNSVDFIDICLDTYCPNHRNCFSMSSDPYPKETIPSIIFQEMMELLNTYSGKKYETKSQFYQDMVVGVFCVFNITRTANNPPPVPYIDMNALKTMFYNKEKYTKENIQTLIDLLKKTQEKVSKYEDKIGYMKNTNEYKTSDDVIRELTNLFNKMKVEEQAILNEVFEKNIENFIQLFEKNNAASPIGTLEFVDQMAKFNAVNNICYIKDNEEISDNLANDYINANGFNFNSI